MHPRPRPVAAEQRRCPPVLITGMTSALRRSRELVLSAAGSWSAHNSSTTGAALAFYSAFSLAPLLVILLTLAGWVRSRLLSLGFILTLGFLLVISLAVSTGISNLRDRIAHRYAGLIGVLGAFDFILSLAIVGTLFALIFRYMPARRSAWRAALSGGLLTAILFDVGRWAVGLYLAHSTQPSAFGAAASFVALLLWVYYSAQIFLFGAEFTAQLAGVARDDHTRDAGTGAAEASPPNR